VGDASGEAMAPKKPAMKAKKAVRGQQEMLMPIADKKEVKETAAKKSTAKSQRKSA